MKLTQHHIEILEHRLDAWDCIVESIEGYTSEEISECCEALLKRIKQEKEISADGLSEIELAVITDCIDGSTFFASIEDEVALGNVSRYKADKCYKAAEELGSEFGCVCATS
jgi:hypothetical protein